MNPFAEAEDLIWERIMSISLSRLLMSRLIHPRLSSNLFWSLTRIRTSWVLGRVFEEIDVSVSVSVFRSLYKKPLEVNAKLTALRTGHTLSPDKVMRPKTGINWWCFWFQTKTTGTTPLRRQHAHLSAPLRLSALRFNRRGRARKPARRQTLKYSRAVLEDCHWNFYTRTRTVHLPSLVFWTLASCALLGNSILDITIGLSIMAFSFT